MIPYFRGLTDSWYEWRGMDGKKYDRRDKGSPPFDVYKGHAALREFFKEVAHQ